jgi:hypothetical protein
MPMSDASNFSAWTIQEAAQIILALTHSSP